MQPSVAAVIFLVVCILAWLAWLAVVLLRKPINPMQNALLLGAKLLTTFLWRTRGPRTVPLVPGRGCVIVCNHRSSVDPFFIQRGTQCPIHWMVAGEYVRHPALRWFLEMCEVIPANRGGVDTAATKRALRYLAKGEVVGMFPEGRINRTDKLFLPIRPGAAVVAIKTRAVILPYYLEGSPYGGTAASPLGMPTTVTVQHAPPIDAAPYADRIEQGEDETAVTRELLFNTIKAIARLAGQPDFEPEMAGRSWKPALPGAVEVAAVSSENR